MKEIKIQVRKLGDAAIVRCSGDTMADRETLSETFFGKLIKEGCRKIALDLEAVTSFYSASVNHLVQTLNFLDGRGADLFLLNSPELVKKVLSATNLSSRLGMYETEYDFILAYGLMDPFLGKTETAGDALRAVVTREKKGETHTLHLQGSFIDEPQGERLVGEVTAALKENAAEILLDLKKTDFISSPIITTFLKIQKMCSEKKVKVRILHANDMVKDIFHLTEAGEFFGM